MNLHQYDNCLMIDTRLRLTIVRPYIKKIPTYKNTTILILGIEIEMHASIFKCSLSIIFLVEAVSVDIKVCGKRENLDELREDPLTSQIETREKENVEDEEIPMNENGESTKEENVKVEKVDQCDDEEGNEKLPKYVPGIPVGKLILFV